MIYQIQKPTRDVVFDYDQTYAKRRSIHAKKYLSAARNQVIDAYAAYDSIAGHPKDLTPLPLEEDTRKALRGNYENTYQDGRLAPLRAELLAGAAYELCPMCGRNPVAELDHYLPKDKYPEFSILAFNLIPVCGRCNRAKSNLITGNRGYLFHAYYDKVPHSPTLLVANLNVTPISTLVTFEVNKKLPQQLYRDACFQFNTLKLADLYVGASIPELVERIDLYRQYHESGVGATGVAYDASRHAKHLRKEFGAHYWKAALYDAVASSYDYCNGGFRLLANRRDR
ncbi:hypothetical protein [Amycolatopsis sp. NPDC051102]|uniref:HNH endonuclease n=1 Tax=Amycolatopsis sp. NPDC051102 TaxID=3155163 RepID=UPI003440B339